MTYTTADFRNAQFATHENGHVAMRIQFQALGAAPADGVWQRSEGGMCGDEDMPGLGYMPVPNLADALIAQQQTMQASLDEAARELSERRWDEGFSAGWNRGHYESGDDTNPHRRSDS